MTFKNTKKKKKGQMTTKHRMSHQVLFILSLDQS